MTTAASGHTVKVHYTGTLNSGDEFDSSAGGEPLEVTLGEGAVIAGFEAALLGMAPGESKTVTIPAEEAYGAHKAERVYDVERERIPPDVDLEVGRLLQARGADGQTVTMTVMAIEEEKVTLDFNHPLAGQDLTFQVELVEIL